MLFVPVCIPRLHFAVRLEEINLFSHLAIQQITSNEREKSRKVRLSVTAYGSTVCF